MPLPHNPRADWPPKPHQPIAKQINRWDSWYARTTPDGQPRKPTVGERALAWATGTTPVRQDADEQHKQIRLPAAADVAQTSADLLFGEPVELRVAESPTDQAQQRLDQLAEQIGLHNRLLEGAEIAAAHGGVYLRPVWDTDLADHPLLTVISATHAVPEWQLGILRAVTFWEELHVETTAATPVVWRHLERHEPGRILHGLYVGTTDRLGGQVPLDRLPHTEGLDDEIVLPDRASKRLLPAYVPNMLPNRTVKGPSGRADIDGSEDLLRGLDQCWTSWMRDLRLGAARLVVDESFLDRTAGQPGARFNLDTEIFTPLRLDPQTLEKGAPITPVEFTIRVEEHARTSEALFTRLVSTAGYSPESFGIHQAGPADSGRALKIRQGRTWRTRGRKQGYWTRPIQQAMESLMMVDAAFFGSGVEPAAPTVVWPDGEADDPRETAETLELLCRARAMSAEMRVRMAQPELDGDELQAEADRVLGEDGLQVEDPFQAGAVT